MLVLTSSGNIMKGMHFSLKLMLLFLLLIVFRLTEKSLIAPTVHRCLLLKCTFAFINIFINLLIRLGSSC